MGRVVKTVAPTQPSQFQLALALAVAKSKPDGLSIRGLWLFLHLFAVCRVKV